MFAVIYRSIHTDLYLGRRSLERYSMLDLRERTSDRQSFKAIVKKEEVKIRSRNVNHGRALQDLRSKVIYVFL